MKIAEIKEMTTNDLVERVEAETANYNQMVINHSISLLYCILHCHLKSYIQPLRIPCNH